MQGQFCTVDFIVVSFVTIVSEKDIFQTFLQFLYYKFSVRTYLHNCTLWMILKRMYVRYQVPNDPYVIMEVRSYGESTGRNNATAQTIVTQT